MVTLDYRSQNISDFHILFFWFQRGTAPVVDVLTQRASAQDIGRHNIQVSCRCSAPEFDLQISTSCEPNRSPLNLRLSFQLDPSAEETIVAGYANMDKYVIAMIDYVRVHNISLSLCGFHRSYRDFIGYFSSEALHCSSDTKPTVFM